MPGPAILRRTPRLFHLKKHHPSLAEGVGIVTTGFVTRVWRPFTTTMARRSGHDPPYPVHATFMTGIAAPCRHHPAVDHPRPAESCRGLMARLAGGCDRNVVCRLAHDPGIAAAMTGRAARHYSRVVIRSPRKRGRGLVTGFAGGSGREVVRWFAHDPGIAAAMTGHAAGHNPLVIHRRPRPKGCRALMARLAP
jgi:hypothetical protein